MIYSRERFGVLFLLIAIMGACNHIEPVYNVENDIIPRGTQQKLSAEQVGNVIAKVAIGRGWRVDEVAPGLLHCTLKWNDHSAAAGLDTALSCIDGCTADTIVSAADITYSQQSYSIHIDPTQNINQSDGMTYRRYNRYVEQLQNEIDKDFSLMAFN